MQAKGFEERVLACRYSCFRSPVALSVVRLVKREGRLLCVEGLDLFDGTPVLDIKPCQSTRMHAHRSGFRRG
ncbi:TrmO family methyltransferase domain-containing protein [Thermofilum pendens]|uniref:TsaA-like domain-containing protein n=1 Tax=Thermofilum pendens (strain DSM 2475 / Hrk 5) TaxID=368408 RepID=A1S0M3_THEPD|nr:TrmO family methyltransferase [Thermofilum pendens]ABL79003.1 conserved hypothetical protein [Thermofilum pendens Hrk 5]